MLKALLAASVAMLACCVAAVWAGPVPPASAGPDGAAIRAPHGEGDAFPLYIIAPPQPDPAAFILDDLGMSDGFVPVLSASYPVPAAASPEDAAVLTAPPPPPVQSAVIPLPTPLYAAVALLGLAAVARRLILRVC